MSLFLYPYKVGSASARALREGLSVRGIRHTNSRFVPNSRKSVINWGASELPFDSSRLQCLVNPPEYVREFTNKLTSFRKLVGYCRLPDFTTNRHDAMEWDSSVCARTVLTGHSGNGLVFCEQGDGLPDAPLYTRYVKKKDEFRVHFVGDKDNLYVQRKMKRREVPNEEVNYQVRNHANGFIYASDPDNIGDTPRDVLEQARAAAARSDLDFGAVDVIYNQSEEQAYVLEINCAPGLQGRTLEFYIENLGVA